ncbi:glutathione S-transferase-like [Chrysoperla carnea]|uniref:glutathione S-transferase-like n=1 Tax=Chrysoperla carnea TaxID=189513 RepID=UPI001D0955B7|nr:glutathione S-transferase-like [Chrysoperla carnea]
MPTYKLTYFNIRGLAEPIRLLLSYGGQDFEDVRIDEESWKKLKSNMPMSQVPVLEIDGKQTHQHIAISRYLAKQFKLVGDNDWEALQIDTVVDSLVELRRRIAFLALFVELYPALRGPDPEVVKKNYEEAVKTTIPFYLEKFNAMAASGYLANGKLSWADIYALPFIEFLESVMKIPVVDKYPNLKKVRDNVMGIPKIKAWVNKRPVTEY